MGAAPRTITVTVRMEDRLKRLFQQHRCCGLSDSVGHRRHPEHPDSRPVILRYLHRAHRRGHVAARAHPVPKRVEDVSLTALEHAGAHGVHARRSVLGPDLLPRLEHEALGDLKRLPRRVCSAHQLLPDQRVGFRVSWPARPLGSSPITGPSTLLRAGPPLRLAVLCPRRFLPPEVLPLAANGPPTPDAIRPTVSRHRFSCSTPAPTTSSRHLNTEHHQSNTQAALWLHHAHGAMLSRGYAPTPVAMLSLFFDASAVVQPRSSSRRTPDPLSASRFRDRFPPRP